MQIFLTKEAQKQYRKLPKSETEKINKKFILLSGEPPAGKKLSGEYKETRSLKAWPYRIIYFINEKQQEIWIISIIHRQGAYK
ncbi:type II toxin-antitoxin system RelE/ParE family toxin [Candidatus Roizmanbacteria bacterium]|nr:type II toxin-antitoxin system RelE/ParE family toxin [Candidatus Roizmanbacteria bacterium]